MTKDSFFDLFLNLLRDAFDSENQIIDNLPNVIKNVSNGNLKEALSNHLEETKNQIQRLKKIFKILNENPTGSSCIITKALFTAGSEWIAKGYPPTVKDAAIIIACQKVEHYEIANYGSICSLATFLKDTSDATHFDYDDVIELLQATLDEEKSADEKLTDIAEGGFFSEGINENARQESLNKDKY